MGTGDAGATEAEAVQRNRDKFSTTMVLLTVASILAPLAIAFLQRARAELTAELLSQSTLVDLSDKLLAEFEVKFRGVAVPTVGIATMRITNSGNIPIGRDDFEQPIHVRCDGAVKVLKAIVGETRPPNLPVNVRHDEGTVSIDPLLLNPGDSFVVQLIIDRTGGLKVGGRIKGVADIEQVNREELRSRSHGASAVMVGLLGLLAYGILAGGFVAARRRLWSSIGPVVIVFIACAVVVNISGMMLFARGVQDLDLDRTVGMWLAIAVVVAGLWTSWIVLRQVSSRR